MQGRGRTLTLGFTIGIIVLISSSIGMIYFGDCSDLFQMFQAHRHDSSRDDVQTQIFPDPYIVTEEDKEYLISRIHAKHRLRDHLAQFLYKGGAPDFKNQMKLNYNRKVLCRVQRLAELLYQVNGHLEERGTCPRWLPWLNQK